MRKLYDGSVRNLSSLLLTKPRLVLWFLPLLVLGGEFMTIRSLLLKVLAIANAVAVTTVFVGCPARPFMPTIAPFPAAIAPPRIDPPPFVTIAPYGGNFQHNMPDIAPPPPPNLDPKNEKPNP
jgi:hypothetical protein